MDVVSSCNTKKSNSKRIKIVRYLNQNNYFIQLYFFKIIIIKLFNQTDAF